MSRTLCEFRSLYIIEMPTAEEYIAKIRALKRPALLKLYAQIKSGITPGWDPGKAFEYLIIRAFELEGAKVAWQYSVIMHDQEIEQIDGAVHLGRMDFLIEAKDLNDAVAIGPIAKLRNQLARRPSGTLGALFSRSGYTDAASLLAAHIAPIQILLWQGNELELCLRYNRMAFGMERKYIHAIEHGFPDLFLDEQELK